MCMLMKMCTDMSFIIVYHPINLVMEIDRITFSETIFKREVTTHYFMPYYRAMENIFPVLNMAFMKCIL